jgi:hypothetical protein
MSILDSNISTICLVEEHGKRLYLCIRLHVNPSLLGGTLYQFEEERFRYLGIGTELFKNVDVAVQKTDERYGAMVHQIFVNAHTLARQTLEAGKEYLYVQADVPWEEVVHGMRIDQHREIVP